MNRRDLFPPILIGLTLLFCALFLGHILLKKYTTHRAAELTQTAAVLDAREERLTLLVDTVETLYSNLSSEFARLEKSTGKLADLSRLDSSQQLSEGALDSLNLAFLLSYSDSLRILSEELARNVDSTPSLLTSIPVRVPIAEHREFSMDRRFGVYLDPFTEKEARHEGLDFSAFTGSEVVATASGRVIKVENHRFWGKRLTLSHGHRFKTRYAHLDKITVSEGTGVRRGQTIGTVGESGLSTGPHVHYEILFKGEPVDPERFIVFKE